jgi:hypothetical protein
VQDKCSGQQRAVAQPDAIASEEFAAHGGNFQLQPAILVPVPLDARAVNHFIFAEQTSGFIPLAADAVEQSVLIRFLVGQNPVFVPDADNTVPATISHGHSLAELSISIKFFE